MRACHCLQGLGRLSKNLTSIMMRPSLGALTIPHTTSPQAAPRTLLSSMPRGGAPQARGTGTGPPPLLLLFSGQQALLLLLLLLPSARAVCPLLFMSDAFTNAPNSCVVSEYGQNGTAACTLSMLCRSCPPAKPVRTAIDVTLASNGSLVPICSRRAVDVGCDGAAFCTQTLPTSATKCPSVQFSAVFRKFLSPYMTICQAPTCKSAACYLAAAPTDCNGTAVPGSAALSLDLSRSCQSR